MDQFFYTTHYVTLRDLCAAHGNLRNFIRQASDHALSILSKPSVSDSTLEGHMLYKINKMEFPLYRVQLNAPPTSATTSETATPYREGFVISLTLEDGTTGFGEVSPLEIHKENLRDVEEQLRFLTHIIEGTTIDNILPLFKCSFSSWIWNNLGITPVSIFPSVRCGLEMALLSAIATRQDCSLVDILHPGRQLSSGSSAVEVIYLRLPRPFHRGNRVQRLLVLLYIEIARSIKFVCICRAVASITSTIKLLTCF